MKIKITLVCPECADTFDTTVKIKDPGEGMLDIHMLDIDTTDALCSHCAKDARLAGENVRPKVSWEKK